tara:strand:- start:99 stop:962 length:864 start_codon:yes stop_codon:yes gene_type:complete
MRLLLPVFYLLSHFNLFSQEGEFIKIENFIFNTDRLKKNEMGIIIPQLDRNLNDRIEFFILETFDGVIEDSKNIIWQSYETTTNPILKSHNMTFTVRVSIRNNNQNIEHRYIEVDYFPSTGDINTNYIWDRDKRNFRLSDQEKERRSYLPSLSNLKIENQSEKPSAEDILNEYKQLLNGINDNFIYFNKAKQDDLSKINSLISEYLKKNYSNVEFVMNIVFDSYHTFISAYDKYHYYTFVVQVKLAGKSIPYFIEVFYNPKSEVVNSDFLWSNERDTFYRPVQDDLQ